MKTQTRNILIVLASLSGVIVLQFVALRYFPHYHDLLRQLYLFPIILSAFVMGLRGGLIFGVLASVALSAQNLLHGLFGPLDILLQAIVFCVTGGLIGYFSDGGKKRSRQLDESKMDFLKSLTKALDARDTYTQGHSLRVASISCEIGRELGLSPNKIDVLYQAALLHDIGKIGVPDHILRKAGQLDHDEYAIIKTHAVIGESILREVRIFGLLVAGVKHHHERYDGLGYPEHLKKDAIPLMARIIAVADSFDAMTSIRVYSRRKNSPAALAEIEQNAGTQFDPAIVTAFRKAVHKISLTMLEHTIIDPVCLMQIALPSKESAVYKDTIFYFCSTQCRNVFLANPKKYQKVAPADEG